MGTLDKPRPQRVTGIALAALILGLLSLVWGALCGIPAIALSAFVLRGRLRSTKPMRPSMDVRFASLGLILSCFGIVLSFAYIWFISRHASVAINYRRCVNNLERIGDAIHQFSSARASDALPAAGKPDGQPGFGLSWRVHILPYLGEAELYRQFRLHEPWDSDHNLRLVARMPAIFRSPERREDFKTLFLGVSGPRSMFNGAQPTCWGEVIDGTANTLMVVEADRERAVVWTKPADWQYDPAEPLSGLGNFRTTGFLGLMSDGSVCFIDNEIATSIMRDICIKDDWAAGATRGRVYLGWDRFARKET